MKLLPPPSSLKTDLKKVETCCSTPEPQSGASHYNLFPSASAGVSVSKGIVMRRAHLLQVILGIVQQLYNRAWGCDTYTPRANGTTAFPLKGSRGSGGDVLPS